jgi:hypothetical protein
MTGPADRQGDVQSVSENIAKIVAVLDKMYSSTMRDADDAMLQKFEQLCDRWRTIAAAELVRRKSK